MPSTPPSPRSPMLTACLDHLKESRMQPSSLPFAVPPLSNPSLLSNFPSSPSTTSVKRTLRTSSGRYYRCRYYRSVARSLCPRTHRMVWRSPPIPLQQCCAYRWKSVPGSLSHHRGLTVPRSSRLVGSDGQSLLIPYPSSLTLNHLSH